MVAATSLGIIVLRLEGMSLKGKTALLPFDDGPYV